MANNISGSAPMKLLWQAVLVVALVAIAWVLGQTIPVLAKKGVLNPGKEDPAAVATPPAAAGASVRFYQLPRIGDSSAMEEISLRIASAQKEVIIVARQLASTSMLTTLKAREAAGVSVVTLLSPDVTTDFARSKLFAWLRSNGMNGVYKDIFTSVSHMIVIDEHTVIISDLPFSQRAYQPADEASAQVSALGFVYIIDDDKLASTLAGLLRQRAQEQNKIL